MIYTTLNRKGEGQDKLLIRVMDKDYADGDDSMGTIFVDISDKMDGKDHEIETKL